MDVPSTVTAALEDRPVAGATCLEAGAGVGNATAGLLAAGAEHVYAVTNDAEHARTVRERVGREEPDRSVALEADLGKLPLADDVVDLVTAHGLFTVVPPASLDTIASEVTRVAVPGCHLVVDDYEPLPADAEIRELFAAENAASQLADGRPALTFYPPEALRRLFEGYGWEFDRERTLLDPVPWTGDHLNAHAAAVRSREGRLPEKESERLVAETERLVDTIGEERIGEMYSLAFRLTG